jgi:thiamine pyrophosphokinase
MKAFLFIGGEYPEREHFLAEYRKGDFIACADSGVDRAASWGMTPDLAVGDMDSISGEMALRSLTPEKIVRLETEKDETDTEAALKELWRRGYDDISIVGGGGGRLDHLLAIALLFDRKPRPQAWLGTGGRALVLEGSADFSSAKGETISVFPLGKETLRMRSEGLRWPLEGLEFEKGYYGISNRATGERVGLEVLAGAAIIIRPYPERPAENRESGRRLP